MLEQKLTLCNKLGLHARSASKLVSVSTRFSSDITIFYKSKTANAKSIMELLMLAAKFNETLTFRYQGHDEQAASEAIEQLILERFGEEA